MSEPLYRIEPDPEFPVRHRVLRAADKAVLHRGTHEDCILWILRTLNRARQDDAVRGIFGY